MVNIVINYHQIKRYGNIKTRTRFDNNCNVIDYTIIDVEDINKISKYKISKCGNYAYANINNKRVALHRIITNTIDELDKIHNPIDHINGNCLDNRKSNLRICTMSDNMYNTYKQRNNSTYKYRTNTGKMTASDYTHLFGYLNPYYRSAYNIPKRRK